MTRRQLLAQIRQEYKEFKESRPPRREASKRQFSSEPSESSPEPEKEKSPEPKTAKSRKRKAASSSSYEPPPKRSRGESGTPNPPVESRTLALRRRRSTSSPGEEAVTSEGWKYKKRPTGARKRPATQAPGAKGEDLTQNYPDSEQYLKLLENFEGDPDDVPLPPGGLISEDEKSEQYRSQSSSSPSSPSSSSSSPGSTPTPKKSAKSKKPVTKGARQGVPAIPQKVQGADKRWYGVSTGGEKCQKCEDGYRKERQLSNHICAKHGGPDPNASRKEKKSRRVEYVCPYKKCPNFKNKLGNGYTMAGHFLNHVRKHHGVTKERGMQLQREAIEADNERYQQREAQYEDEEDGGEEGNEEEELLASYEEEEQSRSDEEEEESSDEDDDD